jgi:two-component system, OmpR family, response regulator
VTQPAKRILLIDDDDDFIAQQELQLAPRGFEILKAFSAREARALLEKTRPDLIVCDLMMEDMDAGLVLAHHIKRKYPDLPVIMVTAVTSQTGIEFAAGLGQEKAWIKADVVLAKPVRFEQLMREIDRLLP